MTEKKDIPVSNIFDSPMLLRNWAVNLIGVLGNAALQQIPNIEKVDELITQFVSDYNNQWEKQKQAEEE
tara:strand:- start:1094 stop:1300 length:207 start_codon:yes stop_codon:yes gene_type:complete